jgi:polyisoprenoid-binding protein YceI
MLTLLTLIALAATSAQTPTKTPAPTPDQTSAPANKVLSFDQSNSKLEFIGSYDDEPIEGRFEKFSGSVNLTDPAKPAFDVQVQVGSLNSDYADRDMVLKNSDWFDAEKFPTAHFLSAGNCTLAAPALLCPGSLTLRGTSKPISLRVTIGKTGTIQGSAELDRKAFGVGSGEWDESAVIGKSVQIRFKLF